MTYLEWTETYGRYRWYHSNGDARVILPLDYNWKEVYDNITRDADIHFASWEIPCDAAYFTSQFYSALPTAWFKYKTVFEMFSGTLDGNTINPDVFEAGYTRTTTSQRVEDNIYDEDETVQSTATATSTQDARTDTNNTKQRTLSYAQGAQGLTTVNNGNIGELGTKYANGIGDNVLIGDTNYGEQNVNANTSDKSTRSRSNTEDKSDKFNETVHETRINYYDNLAFLRERLEKLKMLEPFHKYLEPLFYMAQSMRGDW